jgi:hypothetical protein
MRHDRPPVVWTDDEARAVSKVAMLRWPGGVANQGWDLDVLTGWLGEMQVDRLRPDIAILGLRSVVSNGFVPSVDQVREAARKAMPPMTATEIAAAEERARMRDRERLRPISTIPAAELDAASEDDRLGIDGREVYG